MNRYLKPQISFKNYLDTNQNLKEYLLFLNFLDDYGEACKQARKGMYTSDINTTDSETPRTRTRLKVQFSTSEEESSDPDDVSIPKPSEHVFGSTTKSNPKSSDKILSTFKTIKNLEEQTRRGK